jgi:copper homeostasis protein (lipoprotein)
VKLLTGIILGVAALASLDGCVSSCCRATADIQTDYPAITERVSLDFPATYAGTLPCADCEGIRYTVNFWSDQVFFRRMTYLGKGEGEGLNVDDVGRWEFSEDGHNIILNTKDEVSDMFAIEGRDTFRKLDLNGRVIESSLNYTITRQDKLVWFEPRVRMHGMYSYMADAGWFTECLSRFHVAVAQEADNADLERQYSFARSEPGEAILVSIEGRIVSRPKMEGTGKEHVLVVDRFLNLWAGETCWPEVKVAARSCGR